MGHAIEDAIRRHIQERSRESLRALYEALLAGKLQISVSAEPIRDAAGHLDVPVNCMRLPDGDRCILAFTSITRFLEWKNIGDLYVEMPGRTLFKMARDMSDVDCVFVNYSEKQGAPRGKVTRPEFELLSEGLFPENP